MLLCTLLCLSAMKRMVLYDIPGLQHSMPDLSIRQKWVQAAPESVQVLSYLHAMRQITLYAWPACGIQYCGRVHTMHYHWAKGCMAML